MKKLFIPVLFAALLMTACNSSDLPSGGESGPTGQSLDINEATARQNLENLANSESLLVNIRIKNEGQTFEKKYGAKQNYFWAYNYSDGLVIEDKVYTLTGSTVCVYIKENNEYKKDLEQDSAAAVKMYEDAKASASSYLFFAHIIDANKQYKKLETEETIAGRTAVIYDRDTEDKHERYWVDKTLGVTLKASEYESKEKTKLLETVVEVTSFASGTGVNLPQVDVR